MKALKKLTGFMTAMVCAVSGLAVGGYAGAEEYGEKMQYGDYLYYTPVDEDEDGTFDYAEISDCDESVTEIEIPAEIDGLSVKSIGIAAFGSCGSLTNITIPYSVTSIGAWAFESCSGLESITIPDSVTSIGDYAFSFCESLTDISIPENVKYIGECVFSNCSKLTDINVSEKNNSYCSIDGVLFNKEKSHLIKYPCGKADEAYSIPESVKSIGDNAFEWCTSLIDVILPDSVTSIGNEAFYDCLFMENINIPDSVTSIGSEVFENTSWLDMKREENPLVIINGILVDGKTCDGDIIVPDGIKSIPDRAFSSNYTITGITLPGSVVSIGKDAFFSCVNLTNIVIPASVTSIGDCAFYKCDSLQSVVLPRSVASIGEWAFAECLSLTDITIENPECEIYDNNYTISNSYDEEYYYFFTGTIYGYENSTAQKYAENYDITFNSLGERPKSVKGDINGDGNVSVADAVALQQYLANIRTVSEYVLPDMNDDGVINVFDLVALRRQLLTIPE